MTTERRRILNRTRRAWLLGVLLGLLLVLGAGACRSQPLPPGTAERLSDLAELDQLQAAFEADAGRPRLLLILAPT